MSGLPRSGSTVISSILNQNPEIYASANSPVCAMLAITRAGLTSSEQYLAYPKPDTIKPIMKSLIENYYVDTDKPIVIDKSRAWAVPENFEMLKTTLDYEPRVIMPVRSVTEILASFIGLINKSGLSMKPSFIDAGIQSSGAFPPYKPMNDIRCDYLMSPRGLINDALYGVANAILEENKKYFHIVEYDDLMENPKETIDAIYKFLGLEPFHHDFDNIVNPVKEKDSVYGLNGMHDVRSKLSKGNINPEEVLSKYVLNKYSGENLWRK
jgi:sulfotransferase